MNRLNMSRVTLLTLTAALASANAVNGLTHGDETPTEDPTAARTRAADTPTNGDLVIVDARGENREAPSDDEETRPMLGIGMADGDRGVLITDVYPGTPAHQAGLRPGDEIMGPGEDRFDTQRLSEMMNDLRPGQQVAMRFLRDGEEMNTQVRLASWNPRLMEPDDSDDRERPEMDRIVEILQEVMPGMFEDEDLAMDIDIEVFEEDGNLDLSIMRSSEEFVRAVDGLEGISEVIIMMVEEMLADEEAHKDHEEDHEEGHEEAWEEDGWEHEWKDDAGHGEELQHHVERMLEEAWMEMKGWSAGIEEGIQEFADEFAGEFDHRFEEFARMVDERMHGMEEGVDHRFEDLERMRDDAGDMVGNMMRDRDRGLEDMLRDRDEMMKKMAERFQRRLEETGRNVEDMLRRMMENQARLTERNRMLEARLERLEKAMRDGRGDGDSQRRGARNLRKDRDAGNRNQERRQRRNRDQASQEESDRPRNRRDAGN